MTLTEKCKKDQDNHLLAYSLVFNESADSVSVLCFYRNSCESEHVELNCIKGNSKECWCKNALDTLLNKLVSLATEGAGRSTGLVGPSKTNHKMPGYLSIHCVLHNTYLRVKFLGIKYYGNDSRIQFHPLQCEDPSQLKNCWWNGS